jgi:hypothetical protein
VSCGRKPAHVRADLRQYDGRRQSDNTRDRAEKTDQGSKGGVPCLDLLVHVGDRRIHRLIDLDDRLIQASYRSK